MLLPAKGAFGAAARRFASLTGGARGGCQSTSGRGAFQWHILPRLAGRTREGLDGGESQRDGATARSITAPREVALHVPSRKPENQIILTIQFGG